MAKVVSLKHNSKGCALHYIASRLKVQARPKSKTSWAWKPARKRK